MCPNIRSDESLKKNRSNQTRPKSYIRISYTLNMLMRHCINERKDDMSFMGVESSSLFSKYGVLETAT